MVEEGATFSLVRAEARDGATVLIKTVAGSFAGADARARLGREYEIERELSHPNIARPINYLTSGARPVLILEDEGGHTLRASLTKDSLSLRNAIELSIGIAAALAELHSKDIVHRDLRPENVMVGPDGATAVIIDLSMATVVPRQQAALLAAEGIQGALAYISPEQTGRTSRPVDYRTDLYSLGITMYEMLAGHVPFTSTEPLEVVHDHLAVRPARLTEVAAGVPDVLAKLVARLLEKDPGDRYRSAVGVVSDLERIKDRVIRGLDPDGIELEAVATSSRFQIPDRLFGRANEVAELESWLDKAAAGHTSLVLVQGFSGVGKSSLIQELRTPINERRGYLATGKFDQLDRGSGYHAVTAALRDLVRQLLTEDDERVKQWRDDLRSTLGDGAGALTRVVPELVALIGDVAVPEALEAASARNRFNRLVELLLDTIAGPESAVVLVLDDLQWADTATLDFIERTATRPGNSSLLVVGAYRDNEVDESHPLSLMLQRLAGRGVSVGDIALQPLDDEAMGEFVAASLGRTIDDAAPLTELCIKRTGSNPYFVRLFLTMLYEDGLLHLDPQSSSWSWDMDKVAARQMTDNMVDLAVERIESVSPAAQELISVMALIGPEGDSALIGEIGLPDSGAAMRELATQDLATITETRRGSSWHLAHDRIQEGAAGRFDEATRLNWHKRIGGALLKRRGDGDEDTSIFPVLRHLNAVARQRSSTDRELAMLNLEGGTTAMRATAYDAALGYFTTGVSLLGDDQWSTDPDAAFALHLGAANAARLATKLEDMNRWLESIDGDAINQRQLVDAALVKILHLSHVDKNLLAVDVARRTLADLGWRLPEKPNLGRVIGGLVRTRMALRRFSPQQLVALPEMDNESAHLMMELLSEAASAAYQADPNVMALMIQKGIRLSIENGNDATSPFFYAAFGMVLAGVVKQVDQGVSFGDVAVELSDRFGVESKPSRVRFTRDALLSPVKVPLREIDPSLEKAYAVGMELGDMGFATGAYFFLGLHRLVYGTPLETLEPDLESAVNLLRAHSQTRNLLVAVSLSQFVYDVRHGPKSVPFSGPFVEGDRHLMEVADNGLALCWAYTFRAMSRWHHGDPEGAYEDIESAEEHLDSMLGQALVPVYHLYGVLAGTAVSDGPRSKAMRAARSHRKNLAWFSGHNPTMHEPSLLLADAALNAVEGKGHEALGLYSRAHALAMERGMAWIAAIAAAGGKEIATHHGDATAAQRFHAEEIEAYRNWGATALTVDGQPGPGPTGVAAAADLDIETVVRASEAIGQEIELESLLRSLMEVMLQNAGAERGVLFRVDGQAVVPEAEGRVVGDESVVTVFAGHSEPAEDVADSVVRLVARTGEPQLTERAVDDPTFAGDETIKRRGVRSLLCIPLTTQGRMQGILYLENNQVDGAFTEERYRLLHILSSQAASALEKARLLEEQARLIEAQHRFVPQQFLDSLGHSNLFDVELGQGTVRAVDILFTDIRSFTSTVEEMTPDKAMKFVNTYLAHMEPLVHEFGGFIDAYAGDSILALFDAGSDAALQAAIAMARSEREDNQRREAEGLAPVHTGFGINTDEVMMGVVGGATSLRATIIGDAVNLASRVESLTKRYGTMLLIAENTASRIRQDTDVTLRPLERVQVAGKTHPIQMFEVLDALDDETRQSRLASLEDFNNALATYESGDLAAAASGFDAILKRDPRDTPVALLLQQTQELIASGAEFDGPPITRLDTK